MNRWIEKIKKKFEIDVTFEHEKKGLFIPHRQASWLMVIIIFFGFLCFTVGYFWGHKRALDRFVAKLEEESFADRINYALYTMNDRDSSEFEQDSDDDTITNGADAQDTDETDEMTTNNEGLQEKEELLEEESEQTFFAPLAGFGTLQKAEEFVKKVKYIDPNIIIEKKIGHNVKGRTITWFQAITGEFTSKEELEHVLKRLRKEAHIKDEIKITEKRKG